MTAHRPIGILGGMGPEATVDLMARVIRAVPARDDADHIPLLVDQNPQVPSRIAHLIDGTGPDPTDVLVAMARRLEKAGAAALAMPCNTAHHYAPAIAEAVAVPFLNMVEAAAQAAREADGPVGILGSPAIRKVGLYEAVLPGALYPRDEAALLEAIGEIKTAGATPRAAALVQAASADLAGQGAQVQLIACTEFSLLQEAVTGPRIDTLDVLTDRIVAFSTGAP